MAGRTLLEKTLFSEAAERFKKSIKLAPGDARGYFLLGLTYNLQGQKEPALDLLKHALKLDPDNPEYRYQVGRLLKKIFNYSEALREMNKAVEADPSLYDAWYEMAAIYATTKQEEETIYCLEKAAAWGAQEILIRMRNDADFEWLKSNPKFQSLLRRPVRP